MYNAASSIALVTRALSKLLSLQNLILQWTNLIDNPGPLGELWIIF